MARTPTTTESATRRDRPQRARASTERLQNAAGGAGKRTRLGDRTGAHEHQHRRGHDPRGDQVEEPASGKSGLRGIWGGGSVRTESITVGGKIVAEIGRARGHEQGVDDTQPAMKRFAARCIRANGRDPARVHRLERHLDESVEHRFTRGAAHAGLLVRSQRPPTTRRSSTSRIFLASAIFPRWMRVFTFPSESPSVLAIVWYSMLSK